LLVEDELGLLKMAQTMLERKGYRVLAASTPEKAVRFAEEHAGDIHLVVTDVVMPEMTGKELIDRLHGLFPDLKVLFMSGYTADVIARHGVLEHDIRFIQKPFSDKNLALKVRETLDGRNG
jgi:DNA-binding NtrC family response regulator